MWCKFRRLQEKGFRIFFEQKVSFVMFFWFWKIQKWYHPAILNRFSNICFVAFPTFHTHRSEKQSKWQLLCKNIFQNHFLGICDHICINFGEKTFFAFFQKKFPPPSTPQNMPPHKDKKYSPCLPLSKFNVIFGQYKQNDKTFCWIFIHKTCVKIYEIFSLIDIWRLTKNGKKYL